MVGGTFAMGRINWGKKGKGSRDHSQDAEIDDYEKSNALLSDMVLNYRTVISLGQENVD